MATKIERSRFNMKAAELLPKLTNVELANWLNNQEGTMDYTEQDSNNFRRKMRPEYKKVLKEAAESLTNYKLDIDDTFEKIISKMLQVIEDIDWKSMTPRNIAQFKQFMDTLALYLRSYAQLRGEMAQDIRIETYVDKTQEIKNIMIKVEREMQEKKKEKEGQKVMVFHKEGYVTEENANNLQNDENNDLDDEILKDANEVLLQKKKEVEKEKEEDDEEYHEEDPDEDTDSKSST